MNVNNTHKKPRGEHNHIEKSTMYSLNLTIYIKSLIIVIGKLNALPVGYIQSVEKWITAIQLNAFRSSTLSLLQRFTMYKIERLRIACINSLPRKGSPKLLHLTKSRNGFD